MTAPTDQNAHRVYLRFDDLKALGIVANRVTLGRWIRAGAFPAPVQLGPNAVAWIRSEVDEWRASRPRVTPAAAA